MCGPSAGRTLDTGLTETPTNQLRSELVWQNDGLQQFLESVLRQSVSLSASCQARAAVDYCYFTFDARWMQTGVGRSQAVTLSQTVDQNHQYIVQDVIDKRSCAMLLL